MNAMKTRVDRRTVDLSGYPDLVVVYLGMRWYWRDIAAMEAWTRSGPHREWWTNFLRDSGGTGFWHEVYCMRGGMEAVYDDLARPIGFGAFAPAAAARGSSFSARERLRLKGDVPTPPKEVSERELY